MENRVCIGPVPGQQFELVVSRTKRTDVMGTCTLYRLHMLLCDAS